MLIPLLLAACAPGVRPVASRHVAAQGGQAHPPRSQSALGLPQRGIASWYGPGFAGRLTANGEIFNPEAMTAAHKTLPFDTWVRVVNLDNGMSVVVRINDRGPFKPGRVIDLSRAAAERIGMIGSGTAQVRVELLSSSTSPVWAAVPSDALRGYDVISRFYREGDLLYLTSPAAGEPILVRVVGSDVPAEFAADLVVSRQVFDLLGPQILEAP